MKSSQNKMLLKLTPKRYSVVTNILFGRGNGNQCSKLILALILLQKRRRSSAAVTRLRNKRSLHLIIEKRHSGSDGGVGGFFFTGSPINTQSGK
jgi:hypothetical protein